MPSRYRVKQITPRSLSGFIRYFYFTVMTFMITRCSGAEPENRVQQVYSLIKRHHALRPEMEPQDVYKLLYQSAMGLGHLIADTTKAREYLMRELAALDTTDNVVRDSLTEPIAHDSTMLRVNLRPFRDRRLNPDRLIAAMLGTVKNYSPDKEMFLQDWKIFIHLAGSDRMPFSKDSVNRFDETMRLQNYPMVHHSRRYTEIYRPAYRVILRTEWHNYFKN